MSRLTTKIEVVREEPSTLRKRVWTFVLIESYGALVLDNYGIWERATKRHKYVRVKNYERYVNARNNTLTIQEATESLTDEIRQEAHAQYVEMVKGSLKVGMWEEIKPHGA